MPHTAFVKAVKAAFELISPRSRLRPPTLQPSNHSLGCSNDCTPDTPEQPIRSSVKRPAAGENYDDDPPAKRQRLAPQNPEKPIYKLATVFLKYEGIPMAEIPSRRFRKLASEKVKDLEREIFESNTHRWKLYAYNVPRLYGPYAEDRIKRWVSWLIHSDLRAVVRGESWDDTSIEAALVDARDLDDVRYQDALLDALIAWIRKEGSPGSIDVKWLRRNNERFFRYHDCLKAIGIALIWHYDGKRTGYYGPETRSDIREIHDRYLDGLEAEPEDPLNLSADDFCKTYHSHHEMKMPCYRIKKLPEDVSSP
ncbi:hypothetical protein KCU81_g8194, partial [Aureobasidium melanogenum]|uniref:Uncharacterized protein n=1 Tax=Aureobasidium melanogenum (strain CBS 110374) TaxID=1043003 RepID=A0A074WQF2_AURM1